MSPNLTEICLMVIVIILIIITIIIIPALLEVIKTMRKFNDIAEKNLTPLLKDAEELIKNLKDITLKISTVSSNLEVGVSVIGKLFQNTIQKVNTKNFNLIKLLFTLISLKPIIDLIKNKIKKEGEKNE